MKNGEKGNGDIAHQCSNVTCYNVDEIDPTAPVGPT